MFELEKILRPNIKNLLPYSSARSEFSGEAGIFLDANENGYGSPLNLPYNRYPDPLQILLKEKLSRIKGVPASNIFLGNGSDEAIDILFRAFCRPSIDCVIIPSPTYGMYQVSADINDVKTIKIPLTPDFQLDSDGIAEAISPETKLVFICSPNNPSGNSFVRRDIELILNNFEGIVVIDEAYVNFSKQRSFISDLQDYPNLVILQTLSKAWGLAGLRIGMAFASEQMIRVFNKVKPPYNLGQASQELALQALDKVDQVNKWIREIVGEREIMKNSLSRFKFVIKVYPSDANFLLVRVKDPKPVYQHLVQEGIIVRDRSGIKLCEDCLRITIGTVSENKALLNALIKLENE